MSRNRLEQLKALERAAMLEWEAAMWGRDGDVGLRAMERAEQKWAEARKNLEQAIMEAVKDDAVR